MIDIIPSILTNNPDKLRDLINLSQKAVERAHIDIIDGKFAKNKTIYPEAVSQLDTNLILDYHLMVTEPVNWIEKSIKGFADRIIGQIEMMSSQKDFVDEVLLKGKKVGLAVDLDTSLDEIEKSLLPELDVILVMSVAAGFGGQEFERSALNKIDKLNTIRDEGSFQFKICDDGGITFENIDDAHFFGVDEVVIGRRLFKGDIVENVKRFKKAAHNLNLEK